MGNVSRWYVYWKRLLWMWKILTCQWKRKQPSNQCQSKNCELLQYHLRKSRSQSPITQRRLDLARHLDAPHPQLIRIMARLRRNRYHGIQRKRTWICCWWKQLFRIFFTLGTWIRIQHVRKNPRRLSLKRLSCRWLPYLRTHLDRRQNHDLHRWPKK